MVILFPLGITGSWSGVPRPICSHEGIAQNVWEVFFVSPDVNEESSCPNYPWWSSSGHEINHPWMTLTLYIAEGRDSSIRVFSDLMEQLNQSELSLDFLWFKIINSLIAETIFSQGFPLLVAKDTPTDRKKNLFFMVEPTRSLAQSMKPDTVREEDKRSNSVIAEKGSGVLGYWEAGEGVESSPYSPLDPQFFVTYCLRIKVNVFSFFWSWNLLFHPFAVNSSRESRHFSAL